MKVFVTGASGFVGSAVIDELLGAGHTVTGLARSEESAQALLAKGVEVLKGSLEDIDSLKRGADSADGVIHTAFIHDFSQYEKAAAADKAAIEAIGSVLAGSNRAFIVTGGMAGVKAKEGDLITEDDAAPLFPRASEASAIALTDSGVAASVVRLPPSVHDKHDHGFIPVLINIAREKGEAAYVGDGSNRWSAVHRLDAANLFRLAVEKGAAGARYNGIGDEGIPMRQIAEIIGQKLKIPIVSKSQEEAADHFGWMSRFITIHAPASGKKTGEWLGWQPVHIGLLEDMQANYF